MHRISAAARPCFAFVPRADGGPTDRRGPGRPQRRFDPDVSPGSATVLLHCSDVTVVSADTAGSRVAPAARERRWWIPLLGYLGGAVLGLVLLVATGAKALNPGAFAAEIERQGLAWGLANADLVAVLALALEGGLGLALLLNYRTRSVLALASVLVVFFLFLTGRDWWRAEQGTLPAGTGCGCFGNLLERTPREAFLQDLAILVPSLALAWVGRPGLGRSSRNALALVSSGAAVLTAAFAWLAPELPLDEVATPLRPGVELAALCSGQGGERLCLTDLLPQLAVGRHWVVLADVRGPDFEELSRKVNEAVVRGGGDPVHVLAELNAEEERRIFWTLAPMYDLHAVPGALLRPLYRVLPRTFLVEGGQVVRTSRGIDPELYREGKNPTPRSRASEGG